MTNHVKNDYYISRKAKLLKGFDKVAKRATKFLINHYGGDFASVIISETREKFEQIIPEIPYIGGKKNQIPTTIMIINGWIIPFFQVMKAHGKTSEEVITICYEVRLLSPISVDILRTLYIQLLKLAVKILIGRWNLQNVQSINFMMYRELKNSNPTAISLT